MPQSTKSYGKSVIHELHPVKHQELALSERERDIAQGTRRVDTAGPDSRDLFRGGCVCLAVGRRETWSWPYLHRKLAKAATAEQVLGVALELDALGMHPRRAAVALHPRAVV